MKSARGGGLRGADRAVHRLVRHSVRVCLAVAWQGWGVSGKVTCDPKKHPGQAKLHKPRAHGAGPKGRLGERGESAVGKSLIIS